MNIPRQGKARCYLIYCLISVIYLMNICFLNSYWLSIKSFTPGSRYGKLMHYLIIIVLITKRVHMNMFSFAEICAYLSVLRGGPRALILSLYFFCEVSGIFSLFSCVSLINRNICYNGKYTFFSQYNSVYLMPVIVLLYFQYLIN